MSENLPEPEITVSTELVVAGEAGAALFDEPARLLALSDAAFSKLTAVIIEEGQGLLAQLRYYGGTMAWAAWHRKPDYGAWADEFAPLLGVSRKTLDRYRDQITQERNLEVPAVAALRSTARTVAAPIGRKTAGQTPGNDKMSTNLSQSPADSAKPATAERPAPAAEPAPPPESEFDRPRKVVADYVAALDALIAPPAEMLDRYATDGDWVKMMRHGGPIIEGKRLYDKRNKIEPEPPKASRLVPPAPPARPKARTHNPSCICASCRPPKAKA